MIVTLLFMLLLPPVCEDADCKADASINEVTEGVSATNGVTEALVYRSGVRDTGLPFHGAERLDADPFPRGDLRPPRVIRHTFSAGYGILSVPEMVEIIGSAFAGALISPFTGDDFEIQIENTGPIVLSYAYHRNVQNRIGLLYAYQNIKTTYIYEAEGNIVNDVKYHTFMLYGYRRYGGFSVFEFYGTGVTGLAFRDIESRAFDTGAANPFQSEADRIPLFAGQLNLLGISAGSERVRGHVEFGIGYLGLLQFGLSYSL